MIPRIAFLAFSFALFAANRVDAAFGTIALSWDDCSPIVQDKTTTTPDSYSLVGSVTGCDVAHRGYGVAIVYGDDQQQVPDAWRFDPAGCQGPSRVDLSLDPTGAMSKACPSFSQTAPSFQVTDLNFMPVIEPYATTTMRILVLKSYPDGVVADLSTRYFLFKATFAMDLATAGPTVTGETCGGMEKAICFKVYYAVVVDLTGTQNDLNRPSPLTATWNGGGACSAIPARASTWGGIKAQYRD